MVQVKQEAEDYADNIKYDIRLVSEQLENYKLTQIDNAKIKYVDQ